MRSADLLRYGLWTAVVATAVRNREEYRVPTAWLTHLVGNTVTLFLPDALRVMHALPVPEPRRPLISALGRTLHRRVREDPHYASYVTPLAIGFIASHADYSIYHGRLAEQTLFGFGLDSLPHASAAYALTRLVSETTTTLHEELPSGHALAAPVAWAAAHVDALAAASVASVTLIWEWSEWRAHQAEIRATGRDAHEVNMQWSIPDSITDSISNLAGLLAAIAVRHRKG